MKSRFLLCAVCGVSLLVAETRIVPSGGEEHDVKRAVFGVNQLSYGTRSYEFTSARGDVNPEMTAILKEIGVKAMRYPGGCGGTHGFEWKVAAGLVKGRRYSLGLMAFLTCCEEIGAEPILGLSGLRGTPEEAAEFVEFLNAPDDGAHRWAAERTRLGHPAPFGVKWIEYGNETYDNGHKPADPARPMNGRVYGANYVAFRRAMKAVDPSVQLGVVTLGDSGQYWDAPIFEAAGTNVDFLVVHTYCGAPETPDADYPRLFGRQEQIRRRLASVCARCPQTDVPVLVTEFNTDIKTHRTLTAALLNAESLLCFLAEPRVANADYWQFVNEGFGMVRGKPGAYVKRPNALCYELVTRHTLDRWLPVMLEQPRPVTDVARLTDEEKAKEWIDPAPRGWHFPKDDRRFRFTRHPDGVFETEFLTDEEMNFYHASVGVGKIPFGNAYDWKIEAEVRVEGMQNTSGFGFQFGDGRGFNATHSIVSPPPTLSGDWVKLEAVYTPLKDTKSLKLQLRRLAGGGKGRAFIRNIRLHRVERGAVECPTVGAQLTRSKDGKRMAFVLVNRTTAPETVTLDLASLAKACTHVTAEALTGPSPWATNEETPDSVKVVPLTAHADGAKVALTLPPYALVGVSLDL